MQVRELLAWGRQRLQAQPAGHLEAEVLVCSVLKVDRAWLYANSDATLDTGQAGAARKLIQRRRKGEPVAYLTGKREFWSMTLEITPDVLIPRPETELLVETALAAIPPAACWRLADLGTGSGAIALALALERPRCEVHATEHSEAALRLARRNGQAIAPGKVRFHRGSWLSPLEGKFEVIVSNPPYVRADDPHLDRGDCRYEPRTALTPGKDPLTAIRQITEQSRDFLQPGGLLVLEHGFDQGRAVRQLLTGLGYGRVATRKDIEHRDRVTCGKRDH